MRIAFITLGYSPFRTSGLDVSGDRLVDQLLKANHEVTVIAGIHTPLTEIQYHPALKIHRFRLGKSDWIGFAYRAARCLHYLNKDMPFDVVHFWDIHFAYAYRGEFIASVQHSFRQRLRHWDWSQTSPFSRVYRFAYFILARFFAEIPTLRRATGLLAGSATTRDEFIKFYKVSPERIVLARHGIDTDFFRPNSETDNLRAYLGLAKDMPVILFVGFFTPRKGLNYLAQALPLIHPTPRLIIIGKWTKEHQDHFRKLLGPIGNQVIYAGYVPDEQMPTYYNLANVYVSASLLEGFGLPLAEALACETPVVATDAGAVNEVVGPGGILVPPRDPTALANAISQMLANPSQRIELGEQGRIHVVQHFSIQTMLHETLAAYEYFRTPKTKLISPQAQK